MNPKCFCEGNGSLSFLLKAPLSTNLRVIFCCFLSHILAFLEKSGIAVMLISGWGMHAAIYTYIYTHLGNTPKIQAVLEQRWARGGERKTGRKGEWRGGKIESPTYHRCFCKPFDPQGSERKSGFIMRLNDSVCDVFLYSLRTEHQYIFCPRGRSCPFFRFWTSCVSGRESHSGAFRHSVIRQNFDFAWDIVTFH